MALATREEIATAWRALSGVSDGPGWRSIAISGLSGDRLMVARQFPGNEEALLVGFSTVALPKPGQLPLGSGFRVERAEFDRPGKWLALIRQPQGSLEIFSRMVIDVIDTLSANQAGDESDIFQLFLGRIRGWQHFMSKKVEGLGPEAELGLMGELVCLVTLLDSNVPMHLVLDGWMGPMDGLQDFLLGNGAIEVKSTLAIVGFPARIISLEQLDDATMHPLFVCGCRFAEAAGGVTLPESIAAIRMKLALDKSAVTLFDNALLHVGYSDTQAANYTRKFLALSINFMQVDESFPRLIHGNVPVGIRRAQYEIDLEATRHCEVDVKAVIKMIGIA